MDHDDRRTLTSLAWRVITDGADPKDVDSIAAGLLLVLLEIDERLFELDEVRREILMLRDAVASRNMNS